MRGALLAGLCALALLALAAPAQAYWQAPGAGTGSAVSATMPTAGTPTAAVSGRNVTVTWAQNTFQGDRLGSYAGGGYKLKRYAPGSSTPVSPNASCATTIGGTGPTLECVELADRRRALPRALRTEGPLDCSGLRRALEQH